MDVPRVTVKSYAGYKGEETPRAFTVDGVHLLVLEVVERWYSETHSYFRVRANDQQRYVLRYHHDRGDWELVMQERSPGK
jgi:hypothetical protein